MKIRHHFLSFIFVISRLLFTQEVANQLLYAGSLDSSASCQPTMVTIADVYNRISSGTPAGSHNIMPSVSTGTGSGYTLEFIYNSLPDGTLTTAVSSEVVSGRTFIRRSGGQLILSTGTRTTSSSYCVPDTGQTTSYTATLGEDHDYQPAATQMSYTDNGDGTVTDNRTGLMWLKDANQYNGGAAQTWETALSGCEGFTYAGYTDWRLPNVKELITIVRYEGSAPYINTSYFLNTQSNYYWTSTTYVPGTASAVIVGFNSGYVSAYDKTYPYYVRPVRGGP